MPRVVVSGGTGFIGARVVQALVDRGDAVTVLSRDPDRARSKLPPGAVAERWDVRAEGPIPALENAEAIVHLAGEPAVGARWTESTKREILESRVKSTERIVRALAAAAQRPRVFVSTSAVGYYGAHGDESLDESAPPGADFLAEVTQAWEAAARGAEPLGVRVVRARLGVVFGKGGGALAQMVVPFRLFVGGPIASGKQVVSWVHLKDVVAALLRAVDDDTVSGAVNVVAPNPVTNEELSTAIGKILHRPSVFRVPELALRVRFGEGADPLVTGQCVVPAVLAGKGFPFRFARVEEALRDVLG